MLTHIFVIATIIYGIAYAMPAPRIINGADTDIRNYPFMVSLRTANGTHLCGATIISPSWLLTAAHCVANKIPQDLNIQYALTVVNAAGPNLANVRRIIVHEMYDSENWLAHDIALLEIQGRFIYNYKTLDAVTLPSQDFEVPQEPVEAGSGTLIGWGMNATAGAYQTHLQEIAVSTVSDEQCHSFHNGVTSGEQICGALAEGVVGGHCNGDTGGPFLYKSSLQVGIVSWNMNPCAVNPYVGVYTKVSHYIDWIEKHIN